MIFIQMALLKMLITEMGENGAVHYTLQTTATYTQLALQQYVVKKQHILDPLEPKLNIKELTCKANTGI